MRPRGGEDVVRPQHHVAVTGRTGEGYALLDQQAAYAVPARRGSTISSRSRAVLGSLRRVRRTRTGPPAVQLRHPHRPRTADPMCSAKSATILATSASYSVVQAELLPRRPPRCAPRPIPGRPAAARAASPGRRCRPAPSPRISCTVRIASVSRVRSSGAIRPTSVPHRLLGTLGEQARRLAPTRGQLYPLPPGVVLGRPAGDQLPLLEPRQYPAEVPGVE